MLRLIIRTVNRGNSYCQKDNVSNIMLAGYFNQDVNGQQMQRLMKENGMFDACKLVNENEN